MHFLKDLTSINKLNLQQTAITIGNFDGMHPGHQAIFTKLKTYAKTHNMPVVVILFEPQPKEFFTSDEAIRILPLRDKLLFLKNFGVDIVVCLRFDNKFAAITAESFIQKILIESLKVKYLLVGDNFRFGHKQQGDTKLLQQYAARYNFETENIPIKNHGLQRVSSTWLRELLRAGDFVMLDRVLCRKYALTGKVGYGERLGSKLGFPTININLRKPLLMRGVYAVRVFGIANKSLPAVANIGYRPTVCGKKFLLEVHVLNFSDNCYGKCVQIEFIKKIRREKKFNGIDELKQQITRDIVVATEFFELNKNILSS
ncbi:MAG: bifunctional riboflavin kinase/FMN adenylyltransferase [Thiotrichales bacterium]|nr:MAG: bifunctional riboflavin kinase/FMN adenylyltransferase [Thiotrichales bacterium]